MLWLLAVLLLVGPSRESLEAQDKLKRGQALMATEKFEEAAQAFREAIRLDPKLMMAHYGLGQASMALKQYPPAILAFQQAREVFHQIVGDKVARQFENDKVRDDRIRLLRDRIRENLERMIPPGSPEARQREIRVQQWEIEVASLERSSDLTSAPQTPPGLSLALGSAYFRSGQLADAEREYRAALEVQPKLGEPRNNLAVVLLLTGRAPEAREQLGLAKKNGFKVPAGLEQDVDAALAR